MIAKQFLEQNYTKKGFSAHDIAQQLGCSDSKVTYWSQKHNITKRSISDAIYLKSNPNGDPFKFKKPKSQKDVFLWGLGLGLFWGEGNKADVHAVRLGNTDPDLIKKFIEFLIVIYDIDTSKLTFGLQIFSDTPKDEALDYWCSELSVSKDKFQKVIITKSNKKGTYKSKSLNGVLTVYFSKSPIAPALNTFQI